MKKGKKRTKDPAFLPDKKERHDDSDDSEEDNRSSTRKLAQSSKLVCTSTSSSTDVRAQPSAVDLALARELRDLDTTQIISDSNSEHERASRRAAIEGIAASEQPRKRSRIRLTSSDSTSKPNPSSVCSTALAQSSPDGEFTVQKWLKKAKEALLFVRDELTMESDDAPHQDGTDGTARTSL